VLDRERRQMRVRRQVAGRPERRQRPCLPVRLRFPAKQRVATEVLRAGIAESSLLVPHQAIVEFVAVATRPLDGTGALLDPADARREAEELLSQFDVLFPDQELVRIALRGAAAYELSWFDAHMWAYAERYGLTQLYSEDFQHGRLYGTVEIVNPFLAL
jgi:predicted nucleic acid-binding protein